MGYWLRLPRSTQERRQSQETWEGLVKIRAKRNARNLPDAWDDVPRDDFDDRCWKRHRRHQYKVKTRKSNRDSSRYGEHMARRGKPGHSWWLEARGHKRHR